MNTTIKNPIIMKSIVKVLALVSLLGVLATACHKDETLVGNLPTVVTRTVDLRVGEGNLQRSVLHGDVQWQSFLAAVFDSVDRGYRVSLLHEGSASTKETLTFSSPDRNVAMHWVDSLYNAGYDVTLWYDNEEHHYVVVGQKDTAPGPEPPVVEYPFWPFDEYLPGTWRQVRGMRAFIGINDIYAVYYDWGVLVSDSNRSGYNTIPSFNQALSMINFYCNENYDADIIDYDPVTGRVDTIVFSNYVFIDGDSIYWHNSGINPTILTSPYYITEGDSLQLYGIPGMSPNTYYEIDGVNGHTIPAIEWGRDTLLLKLHNTLTDYGVYVRDTKK